MKNAPFTILKLIAILCFSSIFSTNTESKGEFKIIEMGQQVDPISKESFDLYTRSLVTSQDGFVYVPTLLGFRMYEILTGNKTKDISFPPTGKGCLASANNRGKIELSQNEKYLVMQAFCQIVQVDAKTGAIQRVLFNLDKDGFSTHSFAVSPDENILAVSTNYCIACIWNLKTNKLIVAYTPGFEKYGDLTFSSDGKILLIAGNNIWFQEKNQLKKFKSYIKNVILTNAGYNILTRVFSS